jgi:hypothetical protein
MDSVGRRRSAVNGTETLMVRLILAALLVAPVLAYLGILTSGPVFVIIELGVLLTAGWWFDRGRALGARDPIPDPNRSDYSVPAGSYYFHPIPPEAVQSPEDRPGAPR